MSDPAAIKFRAFLSYSHADTRAAKRLHAQLEKFRLDKDLIGRETDKMGAVPENLRPVFRDREEFTGGHSLTEATIAALDASRALIVLCSPATAASEYVNEEVRLFRHRHPDRPVIPVLIDGTAPDIFPPALRYELDADGIVTENPVTILGTDLRETGDGPQLGLAKIVAGLTGLASDDVYRRAERARRQSARFRNAVIAVLTLLTVAASGSTIFAWQQLKTNEAFLDATLDRFTRLVDRAVSAANTYSLPLSVTLGFLEEAEGMLTVMAKYGRPTPKLKHRRAVMLRAFADNYRDLGRTAAWQKRINEAKSIMQELVASNPDNVSWAFELGLAHERAGNLRLARGDLKEALTEYQAREKIILRLAKADPRNAGWQRDLWVSYWRLAKYEPKTYWPKVIAKLEEMDRLGILRPIDRKWIAMAKERYSLDVP